MADVPQFESTPSDPTPHIKGQVLHDFLTSLNGEVGDKAPAIHGHSILEVTDLQAMLDSLSQRIGEVENNGQPAPTWLVEPTATPLNVVRGESITLTLGTPSAGVPVGKLMQGGVDRTSEINDGDWDAATEGNWLWTVSIGGAAPIVIEGTVTQPQAITVKATGPLALPTINEDQTYSKPLSDLFASPYSLTYSLVSAPAGVTLSSKNIEVADTVAIGDHSFAVKATDQYNQTASLALTLKVQATPAGQTLAVNYEPDATMTTTVESGTVKITVTAPPEYAGSYTVATTSYATGPVNHVAPRVSGQAGPDQTYTAAPGLWSHDTAAGTLTVFRRWQANGVDIPGADSPNYRATAEDGGKVIRWAETGTDANGSRTVYSNEMKFGVGTLPEDVFNPGSSGKNLINFVGASGETWTKADPAVSGNLWVRNSYNLIEGGSGDACYRGAALRGPAQFANGVFRRGSGTSSTTKGRGLAIFISGKARYYAGFNPGTNAFFIGRRDANGVDITLATVPNTLDGFKVQGDLVEFRLERRADGTLTGRFSDAIKTLEIVTNDTTLADGGTGLVGLDTATALVGTSPSTFNGGPF